MVLFDETEFNNFSINYPGDQAALFSGVNYNGYSGPDGFCYDAACPDEPIKVR